MNKYKISVCQYKPSQLETWNHFCKKVETLCKQAHRENSKLLLLPEYFSLELCSLFNEATVAKQFQALQEYLEPFLKLFSALAKQYQLYIIAGTFPVEEEHNQFCNRCFFFSPSGHYHQQDKCYLVRYEKSLQIVKPAESIKTFNTPLGNLAIQVCYDIELPLLTQQYIVEPIDLILIPSCTQTIAGLNRVKICAQARAIEQQCYVLQSGLTGKFNHCEVIDSSVSEAGIYCPSDHGFPEDGILFKGELNQPQLYTSEINLTKLGSVKRHGAVTNFHDLQSMNSFSKTKIEITDEQSY